MIHLCVASFALLITSNLAKEKANFEEEGNIYIYIYIYIYLYIYTLRDVVYAHFTGESNAKEYLHTKNNINCLSQVI